MVAKEKPGMPSWAANSFPPRLGAAALVLAEAITLGCGNGATFNLKGRAASSATWRVRRCIFLVMFLEDTGSNAYGVGIPRVSPPFVCFFGRHRVHRIFTERFGRLVALARLLEEAATGRRESEATRRNQPVWLSRRELSFLGPWLICLGPSAKHHGRICQLPTLFGDLRWPLAAGPAALYCELGS